MSGSTTSTPPTCLWDVAPPCLALHRSTARSSILGPVEPTGSLSLSRVALLAISRSTKLQNG